MRGVFIPIGDENPRESFPGITVGLIGLNIVLFFLWCFPEPQLERMVEVRALLPSEEDWDSIEWWKDIFTSMFMHANLLHLAGNMLFLWIFGDNVEDRLGPFPFLLFYLSSGVVATAVHVAMTPLAGLDIPIIGASGAVSGVLGAYVIFFPLHRVRLLFWIFIYRTPAFFWIVFWLLQQMLFAHMGVEGVAWYAHLGGFAAGAAWALPWRILNRGPNFSTRRASSS
jgi:membrane associated rhomboid family serine protease